MVILACQGIAKRTPAPLTLLGADAIACALGFTAMDPARTGYQSMPLRVFPASDSANYWTSGVCGQTPAFPLKGTAISRPVFWAPSLLDGPMSQVDSALRVFTSQLPRNGRLVIGGLFIQPAPALLGVSRQQKPLLKMAYPLLCPSRHPAISTVSYPMF